MMLISSPLNEYICMILKGKYANARRSEEWIFTKQKAMFNLLPSSSRTPIGVTWRESMQFKLHIRNENVDYAIDINIGEPKHQLN